MNRSGFEMQCKSYYAGMGFKIENRYITVYDVFNRKVYGKMMLSPSVIKRLEQIKEKYISEDYRRTMEVCSLVCRWDEGELYEEAFV